MNHFNIIGIHPLMPSFREERPLYADKAQAIQKALWNKNKWLYFYQGYDIAEDNSSIEVKPNILHDFSLYDTEGLKVSVCAIVGKNGSGKSSTVELMIRLINNLSAALLGEGFNFAAAEHLHFIDHVYAELAFRMGNAIFILEERGRKIVLRKYMRNRYSGYNFLPVSSEIILSKQTTDETIKNPLKLHKKGRVILKSLFYTLVCNYSLYGFNYRDFFAEATPKERLRRIFKNRSVIDYENMTEDHFWLKGIFHKNDGYQTPVVLHPMREDGRLNITKENYLAKERMCNLLFYKDSMGFYPQRIINGNLHIIAIGIRPTSNRKFERDKMLKNVGIGKRQNISLNFDNIYNWILDFWDDIYNFKRDDHNGKLYEDAYDYIVYKTLKIISNYKKYTPIYNYLSKTTAEYDELREKLKPLSEDFTHITKKLLRTIMYLKTDVYADYENNYPLNDLDEKIRRITGTQIHPNYRIHEVDLLPSPIFDVNLFIEKDGPGGGLFDFRNLSSGERQIAYTISNFMYHLVNIDSEWNDYYRDVAHTQVIKYRYVNVIFDEVELYFHPELQRKFMGLLCQAIQNAHFRNLRGINILLATHSPFILSDIPDENILCLGEETQTIDTSFGDNIITLLTRGFFIDSTIGELARQQINDIATTYFNMKEGRDVMPYYKENRMRFKYLTEIVSDPYLKSMVRRMVKNIEVVYKSNIRENNV